MVYTINDISKIVGGQAELGLPSLQIDYLLIDSRRLVFPSATLFFAFSSARRNGESFIEELYHSGVRSFVVSEHFNFSKFLDANFVLVNDPLGALQRLAAFHRKQFTIPVIGITGSNGKTIVKEWLYHLLQKDYNIVRSPKSYNSQIGVALSVWQMSSSNTLAIFEAGISQVNEMELLEHIIQPTIGILTNVGAAHSAGFFNKEQKVNEKLMLFKNANTVVSNNQDPIINAALCNKGKKSLFIWGNPGADVEIVEIKKSQNKSTITGKYKGEIVFIAIPFTDDASIENAITCWSLMLFLNIKNEVISERMDTLQSVEMRLQLKKGIGNCSIINDSYSNDLSSLRMALDFLHQQAGNQPTSVILSDLGETGSSDEQYQKVLQALVQHKVEKFIGIGPRLVTMETLFNKAISQSFFFNSVEAFIAHFSNIRFRDEVILLKGARAFEFERINLLFEQKIHQTVLEVNLSALVHNLKQYQHCLQPTTRVMAMVKAFSYGSGSAEVASVLQFHKVDYLAVAYADEGVELRKSGIQLPIMIMNPEVITFQSLVEYNLEPEMYSFSILHDFNDYLHKQGLQQFPVHVKIDTGMHRLGFEAGEMDELKSFLAANQRLVIKSVFSHFVASENNLHDPFTHRQAAQFIHACDTIEGAVGYTFIRHIANSAAIFRHPQYQYDMVRLGIGLYGVDSTAQHVLLLQPVATLRTTIAQIRLVKKGESVGYNRKGILLRDSLIATIRIGYADGFSRKFGNGKGQVYIKDQLAPVVGSVCMDMTMVDITEISGVSGGDIVEIFGSNLPISTLAEWGDTIPYEIMTNINQRVKREYYEE